MLTEIKQDSNEGIFFQRELEKVKTQTYDVVFPEPKARKLFPTPDLDGDHGAKSITYRMYESTGGAKIIANYATDFPRVGLKGKEYTSSVKEIGLSYGYTLKDIMYSMKAGKSLDSRLALETRRITFQKEEAIAYFGDTANNLPGFFTNANIPNTSVTADGESSSPLWSAKTAEQIIRDVNEAINEPTILTKGVESVDTVVMPVSAMSYLKNTPFGSFGLTLFKFIQENNPQITMWESLPQLETAGTGNTRLMAAYNRSPLHVSLEIPMEYMALAPQLQGAQYTINTMESIGGVIVYKPLACNFVYGF